MNKKRYQELVKKETPKENQLKNLILSFSTGGLIGIIGNLLYTYFLKFYKEDTAVAFTLFVIIMITSFLTATGIADELFSKLKCGLIIPITGFAHSISSSIIDYKSEGLINMGSNAFKLAGSVLLYGMCSAIILTLLKVILNV